MDATKYARRRVVQARYREAHPEMCKRSDAKWRAKNPDRAAESQRARARRYYRRHRNAVLTKQHAKYQRGSERPHLSAGEKAEADAFYAMGLTFKEISQRLKRTGGTIARYLRTKHVIRTRPVKSGPGSSGWRGGRVMSKGYVYLWLSPDDAMSCMRDRAGRIAEHRLVMARALGRPLLLSETVHHIDGTRSHNEAENLQLRQGRHGKGIVLACLACGSHRVGPVKLATTSMLSED